MGKETASRAVSLFEAVSLYRLMKERGNGRIMTP